MNWTQNQNNILASNWLKILSLIQYYIYLRYYLITIDLDVEDFDINLVHPNFEFELLIFKVKMKKVK